MGVGVAETLALGQAGRRGGTGKGDPVPHSGDPAPGVMEWNDPQGRVEGVATLSCIIGGAGCLSFCSLMGRTWCLQRVGEGLARLGRKREEARGNSLLPSALASQGKAERVRAAGFPAEPPLQN